jgi:hypothetical protein
VHRPARVTLAISLCALAPTAVAAQPDAALVVDDSDPADPAPLCTEEIERALEEAAMRDRMRRALLRDYASGPVSAADVQISVENRAGALYRLVEVTVLLNAQLVYRRVDPGGVDASSLDVFRGSAPPGVHELTVHLGYRGAGPLPYTRGYHVQLTHRAPINARQGSLSITRVVASAAGGPATPFLQRLQVHIAHPSGVRQGLN